MYIITKYNGHCAYTGKPLGDDWQVDHVMSKYMCLCRKNNEVDSIENVLPAIKIINHYKRSLDLEGFRDYMLSFHKRLNKLPKKIVVYETQRRKDYMFKIAELFDITPEKPFDGKFYFEKLIHN